MQITDRIISCLYLHDSLMAAVSEEQTTLRLQYTAMNPAKPFNLIPPFCPFAGFSDHNKPEIHELMSDSGWILRPVHALSPFSTPVPEDFQLPGYPPLPRTRGFILGYAGDKAEELLHNSAVPSKKFPETPVSVRVWYQASLHITVEHDEKTGLLSARWEIEKNTEGSGH